MLFRNCKKIRETRVEIPDYGGEITISHYNVGGLDSGFLTLYCTDGIPERIKKDWQKMAKDQSGFVFVYT